MQIFSITQVNKQSNFQHNRLIITIIIIIRSRSSAKAPQRNTYKPQNVQQISKMNWRHKGTVVKCKMEQPGRANKFFTKRVKPSDYRTTVMQQIETAISKLTNHVTTGRSNTWCNTTTKPLDHKKTFVGMELKTKFVTCQALLQGAIIVIAQYINYTVCSLHCQKCPAFFCLCCVIRTFLGGSRHYMVKKKCFQFLSIILILYIF